MKIDFREKMKTRPEKTVTRKVIEFYLIKSPENLLYDPDIKQIKKYEIKSWNCTKFTSEALFIDFKFDDFANVSYK